MSSVIYSGGEAMAIVRALRPYLHRPIPVEFLAKLVDRRSEEILDSLQKLQARDVVKLTDDQVILLRD
jgi:hypothetical protein